MNTSTDPVCGMRVLAGQGLSFTYQGQQHHFCSDLCRRTFEADPARYASGLESASDVPARRIAYFSMEVAVDPAMPTYSGGLGILAGDTLRALADLQMPAVGVSLLYRRGYFEQHLDSSGNQSESPVVWNPADFARLLPQRVVVNIEGRRVTIGAWHYAIQGIGGHCIPLYLLDTDLEPNDPQDRVLTHELYGGDQRYRLAQEIILGIGGIRMLRALGYHHLQRFHMNEGHAALLPLELLNEPGGNWDFNEVRSRCVFTTHTPVPAGHDQFPWDLVKQVLSEPIDGEALQMLGGPEQLNLTRLALNTSHYVNGVAKRHGQVSRQMFSGYAIEAITNGVHSYTWTCDSFRRLYDRYIPDWAKDPFYLRYAISIPGNEIWKVHTQAKLRLLDEVQRCSGQSLNPAILTIGFARRATAYKRADLLFHEIEQLADIVPSAGPIQIVMAGKAHPRDDGGKQIIRRIFQAARQLAGRIPVVYLENYDLPLGQLLTAGVDVWLNTPLPPQEASGTSGMKAAHNGVPSLSVLDGWWIEGHIEGITGWSIGPRPDEARGDSDQRDAADLYHKLRSTIVPLFYGDREEWTHIMRQAIALNASFFNTHRMVQQYAASAYV